MRPQHVFWFCVITSCSSLSKGTASLAHKKSETIFNLEGGMKLSSNMTILESQLVPNDRNGVQDVVTFIPKQAVNFDVALKEERSTESSLYRNKDSLGEVSMPFDDNSEHGMKNISGAVKPTNNYETPLQDKAVSNIGFGSSANVNVSSEQLTDFDDVPSEYDEEEYVTGNGLEAGNVKNEVSGNVEFRNESPVENNAYLVPMAEAITRENNVVIYTPDSSAQSTIIDDEIQVGYDITASSTFMTINDGMKASNDTGNTTQSEPHYEDLLNHVEQQGASEYTTASYVQDMSYTENISNELIKTSSTESSNTVTVTERINILSDLTTWRGIHGAGTSEEPAKKYTWRYTLSRSRETTRPPYQVQNDYADDYYEVWSQNGGQSKTMSVTDSKEIEAKNSVNQRTYAPYFLIGRDTEHSFGTETVKNFHTSDAVDYNAVRKEGIRATTDARKAPVSMQDSATSKEDIPHIVELERFRVLEKNEVVNKDWDGKYNSMAISNKIRSAVSNPPVSPYGTFYTETNKFNLTTNVSHGSTFPEILAATKEYEEESTKSMPNIESSNASEFRAQRESLTEDFTISDDFAACKYCDTLGTDTEARSKDVNVLEVTTEQKPASDISTIPENYELCAGCVEVLNKGIKTVPESQNQQDKDWNKCDGSKSTKVEKTVSQTIVNEMTKESIQSFRTTTVTAQTNISTIPEKFEKCKDCMNKQIEETISNNGIKITTSKSTIVTGIREISFSDYPWFVTIEKTISGMRCSGAMVAPRWLLTASCCLRTNDSRTDGYSVAVEVPVNVSGRQYRTMGAVFAPGGRVALLRLQEPPESALLMTGYLDVAYPGPPTLWTRCVVLGMGRYHVSRQTGVCGDRLYATGTWAESLRAAETAPGSHDLRTAHSTVRAGCSGGTGSPLACHRRYSVPAGSNSSRVELPENEPAQLVLVGVYTDLREGVSCHGKAFNYWGTALLQVWVHGAIVSTNRKLEKMYRRHMLVPPDPYKQRLLRLRSEDSLPPPRISRAPPTTSRLLICLLAAAVSGALLAS